MFAGYKTLSRSERPGSDDEKQEHFMIHFSKATGKNLGPFFETWGWPISQSALEEDRALPGWMPEDWPG